MAGDANGRPKQGLATLGMVLAVIGGMAAIVRPMNDQIRINHDEIEAITEKVTAHLRDGHPTSVKELISTEIDGNNQLFTTIHEDLKEQINDIKKQLTRRYSEDDDAQWERIKAIERALHGKDYNGRSDTR